MGWKIYDKVAITVSVLSTIAIVASRAPKMINEVGIMGFKLNINVGHIIVFGIPLIFLSLVLLWVVRDEEIQNTGLYSKNRWVLPFLTSFPSFCAAFLLVQFIQEFAPSIDVCNEFDWRRMFWDFSLLEIQPDYCFSLPTATQELMPYIYPPVQTWTYFALVIGCFIISFRLVRMMRA